MVSRVWVGRRCWVRERERRGGEARRTPLAASRKGHSCTRHQNAAPPLV